MPKTSQQFEEITLVGSKGSRMKFKKCGPTRKKAHYHKIGGNSNKKS